MDILQCMRDEQVFGSHFADRKSWQAWRAFLGALFGLPLPTPLASHFNACTGRASPTAGGYSEAWLVCGRRSGKSFVLSLIAVYLASFKDWRPFLGPGEKATIMVIASDRKQSRVILGYIKGLLQSVEMLAATIASETAESITLTNRVVIEVHTASFRSVRGYTIVAALLDEIAFWPVDEFAASPDTEVINALKPAMATVPGAMLLCASSPYARKGALWNAYQRHHGKDSKTLIWSAPTRTMNPTVPQHIIDNALAEDPAHASAEWLAIFRSDVETFISLEAVQGCISDGVLEHAPAAAITYKAFCDPSGGSSDSFTMAVAHRHNDRAVLDAIREIKPPFSPEAVVKEFAELAKSYRCDRITGDRYSGEFVRELFVREGIRYIPAEKTKSDLYLDLLPAVNSRLVDLLDHPKLVSQLTSLERKTSGRGRDIVDHPSRSHDDLSNAAAGALVLCLNRKRWELPNTHAPGLPVVLPGVIDDVRRGGSVNYLNRLNADW